MANQPMRDDDDEEEDGRTKDRERERGEKACRTMLISNTIAYGARQKREGGEKKRK